MNSDDDLDESLFRAVHEKNIHKIKKIIQAYPDIINKKNNDVSVLYRAVLYNLPPHLIQFLIDNGAHVNTCDGLRFKDSPLILSLIRNVEAPYNFEIAKLLIKNGADINYQGGNCPTPLEAIIKDDVGTQIGSYHPSQVSMKKKILNFLFNTRDSEGRRIEVDCHSKIFELARENHGADFEAFLIKKCNEKYARNITSAEEAWRGNKSGNSGFGKLPRNVMGKIYESLGAPQGSLKPDGTRRHLHPALVKAKLRGLTIPKGQERSLAELHSWAEGVREGTSKARATHEAAQGLVSLSQQRPYYTSHGKTVRHRSQLKLRGGRRRRTRRRR
jgi:hypothetical protein